MSSPTDNAWDRLFTLPTPSLEELAPDFTGYSFGTSGWGEECEIEVASLPSTEAPALPRIDFNTLETPKHCQKSLTTPHVTPFAPRLRLDDLNSFPPCPSLDAHDQESHLPHVPEAIRTAHVAAARDRYMSDIAASGPFGPFGAFPLRTSHLATANTDFDNANDRADRVLGGSAKKRFGSFVGNAQEVESARKGIGRSAEGEKKRGRGRPRKNKENKGQDDSTTSKAGKPGFSGEDLIMIARVVVDKDPFLAPHGQKGAAWQEVVDILTELKFRHASISAASIQHKAEALVSYKKDPTGKYKNLTNVIREGTSASITIGALLERLETQFDAAKDKTDDAKAKLQKKNDEDREGGESIRRASMQTLRKRARSPNSDTESDTDRETAATPTPATPTPAARAPAASSSLESINSEDDNDSNAKKSKSKRRRRMDRRSGSAPDAEGFLAMMDAENKRRSMHDERVAKSLEMFVSDSRQQKMEFTSLLKELVTSERR
ncbi:hypothetical protein DFH09DRAFT_1104342 [Mycena vulgaris]|nr:hypothetical protein DFH09DRAFT_1104342 [Mycena vulgaris]